MRDAGYGVSTSPSYQKQYVYTYNQYGQKLSETNLGVNGGAGVVTGYTYGDSWGNLTQVVQDTGAGHLNRTTSMTYDIAGHVLTSTDPNNKQSVFTYNVLGQPATAFFPSTASTVAETIYYGYGGNGRTETVTDNRGQTSIAYEAGSDRVKSVTDPITGAVSYTYDTFGDRLSMSLPGGGTWTYAYGGADLPSCEMLPKDDPNSLAPLLRSITDDAGRKVDYRYNLSGTGPASGNDSVGNFNPTWVSGRFNQVRYNQVFSGGNLVSFCQTDYLYEVQSQTGYPGSPTATRLFVSEVRNTFNQLVGGNWQQTVLVQNDYSYDNAGQRLTNAISDNTGLLRTEQYGYDEINRLKTVNYGDGQTQSYTFDAMSNRASKTDVGGGINGTESYTVNNANMLLSRGANNYTNDMNGNTLTGGGRTNTWDSENRLYQCVSGGTTSVYTYGADGLRRRAAVTVGGNTTTTDFILDASMQVRERRNSANYATYLVGPRGPEYRRDDVAGTVRWYLYDGLGSVLGEIDPSGNVTATRKYDVYGSVRASTGTSTSKQKFVGGLGHPSDDETGLIYMRARYMDPVTGRFLSPDPGHQGYNDFAYCANNPVNLSDRDGKYFGGDELISFLTYYLGQAFSDYLRHLIEKRLWSILAAELDRIATNMINLSEQYAIAAVESWENAQVLLPAAQEYPLARMLYNMEIEAAGKFGAKAAWNGLAGVALREMAIILEGMADDDMSGTPIMPPPGF